MTCASSVFFILLASLIFVHSYKILITFQTPAPSHQLLGYNLARGLIKAGHDVTFISPFEQNTSSKGGTYRNIVLKGIEEINHSGESWMEFGEKHPLKLDHSLDYVGNLITNFTLSHPNFQNLLNSNEKFDIIILEQFANDALKVLSCFYQIPLISFSTFTTNAWTNPISGNPAPPSYIPDSFLSYSSQMSLWERTMNSLFVLFRYFYLDWIFYSNQAALVKEYFPQCYPDFYKTLYNVSLTFINTHESTNDPVPLVPSIIPIGGFHLQSPKALPKNLQIFMDNAKEGVVYFSLGSNIVPSQISNYTKECILRSFGKLKQKVLWKWDEDYLHGKPENVKLGKWFPQQDILAHPNIKLFVSHGGLLSTIETVYHGVPVLALPIFGDQRLNAARIQDDGYGLSIWLTKLTEEKLTYALDELLNNSKYRDNVKRRSVLLKDRPMNPMDLAVYWTEYVIKHNGAAHLRVKGLDLSWYQYLLLDVIVLVIASIISFIFALYYISNRILVQYKCRKLKQA